MSIQDLKNKPTCISLFAGGGGSSLGYKQAGFRELLAVDFDKDACETLRLNFPDIQVLENDIKELDSLKLTEYINGNSLTLLDASPPCQGFSSVGKQRFNDDRNDLFMEFIRILNILKPQAFIVENVIGMIYGKMKLKFKTIMEELEKTDYNFKCKILNAWWYGVPQHRRRLIWIGFRKNLNIKPSYPKPICSKPISVQQILGNDCIAITSPSYGNRIRSSHLCSPAIMSQRKFEILYRNQDWRWITVDEAKLLQGFPIDFQITRYKLIGNSVPPPMSKAIGIHVLEVLKNAQACTYIN